MDAYCRVKEKMQFEKDAFKFKDVILLKMQNCYKSRKVSGSIELPDGALANRWDPGTGAAL